MKVVTPVIWLLGLCAVGLISWGWIQGLTVTPQERSQGDLVRIMFAHVPSAWVALFAYAFMAGASFVYYTWRHALADEAAKAAGPFGAACTAAALLTGAVWGQPTWGVYWAWDARMASTLILFLLYLGYFALRAAFDDENKGALAGAIYCMVSVIILPIVKYSVEFWNTLHQPSGVFENATDAVFKTPLYVSGLGFLALFGALTLWNMRSALIVRRAEARVRRARSRAVFAEPPAQEANA